MRLPEGRALRREAEASGGGERTPGECHGSPGPRARGGEEVLNSLQTASTSAAACGPATVSTATLQTELQPGDFGDFLLGHQPSGWRSFY